MTNVAHSTLTGSNLHENKGVASASDDTVATASSGSTVWKILTSDNLDTSVISTRVLLDTKTASNSSSLAFTSSLTSTYNYYEFDITNILPSTGDVALKLEFSADGGSSWITSGYISSGNATDSSPLNSAYFRTDSITLNPFSGTNGIHNGSNYGMCGQLRLYSPSNSTSVKNVTYQTYYPRTNTGGVGTHTAGGGFYGGNSNAVNAVRFLMTSGNITSGNIKMYGIIG